MLKLNASGEIPGCGVVADSNATVGYTPMIPAATSVSPWVVPMFLVINTNVTPQNTSAVVTVVCMAEPICPATAISPDAFVHRDMYQFRDDRLAKSEAGQELIRIYYKHSPEVTGILMKHPALAARSAAILKDIMPGTLHLLGDRRGRNIVMTSLRVARIQKLFADISQEGSDELANTLSELSQMLDDCKGMRISRIWGSLK